MELGLALGLLGAAAATLLAGIGSAIGIGIAGSTAAGVISEDPDKFGLTIVLCALPGTQGIYGLIMGFLILFRTGIMAGDILPLTIAQGLGLLFAALPVGFVGWFSAIYQGKASAAAIQTIAKRPEEFGKAMIYPVMVETYAVFALLMSIMIFMFLPL
ncbi:MAG TPA: V-type ATP synthase subunit K [Candidatus Limnocylindrales bacterium]|nr:V-type ATP synthase subunit K [Candidatus Limnocylindrales bacterium]